MKDPKNLQYQQGYNYGLHGLEPAIAPVSNWDITQYRHGYRDGVEESKRRVQKRDQELIDSMRAGALALDMRASAADAAWVRARRLEWEASQ